MSVACVLFDLDDTLYPAGAGLMKEISARLTRYVAGYFDISLTSADALRRTYNRQYGSAVRALIAHHQVDREDLLGFAHDVDVEASLGRDEDLDCLLGCIQAPKAIFTNAPHVYAERVLAALGIRQHFERLFDFEFGDYRGKPDATVYRRVQAELKASRTSLVMVDDSARNLAPAHALRWTTIWLNPNDRAAETQVDYVVRDLWQVAEAFHRLGVMDSAHRATAAHRLAGCAWARVAGAGN